MTDTNAHDRRSNGGVSPPDDVERAIVQLFDAEPPSAVFQADLAQRLSGEYAALFGAGSNGHEVEGVPDIIGDLEHRAHGEPGIEEVQVTPLVGAVATGASSSELPHLLHAADRRADPLSDAAAGSSPLLPAATQLWRPGASGGHWRLA